MESVKRFFKHESASGVMLVIATILALVAANSAYGSWYFSFIDLDFFIGIGEYELKKHLLLWINDGLMAIFFLLVGLELKREFLLGHLQDKDQIIFPFVGAIGGIVVPVLFFVAFNYDNGRSIDGWAIPAATDIAFALGVLALFGKSIPKTLKIFLLTLAIIDDLAAILIIAFFYTHHLSAISLMLAFSCIGVLTIMNRLHVNHIPAYLLVGLIMWFCVLKSGVHATLAGVALAFFIPLNKYEAYKPLIILEEKLKNWVGFFILPIFAFANAGLILDMQAFKSLTSNLSLGILCGLFLGKQIGITLFTFILVKLKLAKLPEGCNWLHIYAVSVICGIGFTMSFFISSLAFGLTGLDYSSLSRMSILVASLMSALYGSALLYLCTKRFPQAAGSRQTLEEVGTS